MKLFRICIAAAAFFLPFTVFGIQQNSNIAGGSLVSGILINSLNSDPLSGVRVVLQSVDDPKMLYSAERVDNEKFVIRDVRPGKYQLLGFGPGYRSSYYGQVGERQGGATIEVTANKSVENIRLQMIPAGTIFGTIFDSDHEPVPAAHVVVFTYTDQNGSRKITSVRAALTNDLGEFRVANLSAGEYFVGTVPLDPHETVIQVDTSTNSASLHNVRINSRDPDVYIPTYFPNATDITTAAAIQLHNGEKLGGINIVLHPPVQVHTVRGVAMIEDKVATGELVVSTQRDNQVFLHTRTSGTFEISLPSGSYFLNGILQASSAQSATAGRLRIQIPLEVGATDLENVRLVAIPLRLDGHVTFDGSGTRADPSTIQVTLRTNFPDRSIGTAGFGGPDGRLALGNLVVGQYQIEVSILGNNNGNYVKALKFGAIDVSKDGRIDLNSAAPNSLNVVIGTNGGRLEGSIENGNGNPVNGLSIALVPTVPGGRMDLFKSAMTQSSGKFSINGIAPGDYRVIASDNPDPLYWADPDVLRKYNDRSQLVHITEGGTGGVELQITTPR